MKKLILPVLLLLLGVGGGIATALFVFPPQPEDVAESTCVPGSGNATDGIAVPVVEGEALADHTASTDTDGHPTREYARLNNQFVVPIVEGGRVSALMVLSLSVEVQIGTKEAVFAAEPKLRDVFLSVLFDHANIGGFNGNFTSASNMRILRRSLKDAAQAALGAQITDVLIVDIVRQDI